MAYKPHYPWNPQPLDFSSTAVFPTRTVISTPTVVQSLFKSYGSPNPISDFFVLLCTPPRTHTTVDFVNIKHNMQRNWQIL